MEFKYKLTKDKETRKKESQSLREKYPDYLPIVLEKDPTCRLKELKKTKYLLQKKYTVNQFLQEIREKVEMQEGEALFLQAKLKYALSAEKTIEEIYNSYKDEDGLLYIMYSSELIFG